jgi:hypothetical protein
MKKLRRHHAGIARIACGLLLLFALAPVSRGMDTIWSAIVLGTNTAPAKEQSAEITRLHAKLKDVFGYNQFRLIREHSELMDSPVERWLLPGKLFSLRVSSARKVEEGYHFHLQVFQEKKMLAETEANLGMRSPVFIRGPLCGRGQLIFILLVR